MDPNQSSSETTINDLYMQAKKAAGTGDKRASGLLIHQILKLNFTHAGAWAMLHTQYGGGRPFEEFQREFAGKYFPAQAHLLEKPTPAPEAPILGDTDKLRIKPAPAPEPAPAPGRVNPAPPTPLVPDPWDAVGKMTAKPGPETGSLPVLSAQEIPARPTPAPATPMELNFCPQCGQQRTSNLLFCGRCGYQYAPTAAYYPPAAPAPVHAPASAAARYPAPIPATPRRFTPKRIITAIGLLLIILAGIVNWSSSREWQGIFNGGYTTFGDVGLGTDQGKTTTLAGLLGFILLFSIRSETPAHIWSAVFAFGASIAAYTFARGSWGYSGGTQGIMMDYSSMGPGPYMVFVGAAIVLGCFFIPARKAD